MKWSVGILSFLLTLVSAGAQAEGPLPVSPDGQAGMAVVSGRCPTFHWTSVEGAESVDLVVYRVPKEESDGVPDAVLSVTLPGSAHGWTPSLGRCLDPGGRYAWSVRATDEAGEGEWSEASLFQVSAPPSVMEVEEALRVLRRYVREGGEKIAQTEGVEGTVSGPPSQRLGATEHWAVRSLGERSSVFSSGTVGAAPSPRAVVPPASYSLTIDDAFALGGYVFKEGKPFLHNDGGYGAGNTALGLNALISATPGSPDVFSGKRNTALGEKALLFNTSGKDNTAIGSSALVSNITGYYNTATGSQALALNMTGSYNTATGFRALFSNSVGNKNTATGYQALRYNGADSNTATGFQALEYNYDGSENTATGYRALRYNDSGNNNTATGSQALRDNSSGSSNTATGREALANNSSGISNTATGSQSLAKNDTGIRNTASGAFALSSNTTGHYNTATGAFALKFSSTGSANTAVGLSALERLDLLAAAGGSYNIAVGKDAGYFLEAGDNNIFIGNEGPDPNESNTVRIGNSTDHTRTFIAGIHGVTTDMSPAIQVLIDSDGQLGTVSSSRRFKRDIQDMGETSGRLLDLRPVTFRFSRKAKDGSQPLQFGLIAEEVAEVLPELVTFNAQGEPETVLYHLLSSMLLNELQKQHRRNRVVGWLLAVMLLAGGGVVVGRRRLV